MFFGPRVILRAFSPEDLEPYTDFRNDLEVELLGGYNRPYPKPRERFKARLEAQLTNPEPDDLWLAIEADAKLIGELLLMNMDRESRTWELGISIGDRRYWSRAYGREAINVALDYAFRVRNIHKVYLETAATNERALRAYRASGFVEEGRLREHVWRNGSHVDIVRMGILRREWVERHGDGPPAAMA